MKKEKVYVVVLEGYIDSPIIEVEIFNSPAKVKDFYNKAVSNFLESIEGKEGYIISNSETCFEGYKEGNYAEDHFTITLMEKEVKE